MTANPYTTIADLSAMLLEMTTALNGANAREDSLLNRVEELSDRCDRLQYDLDNAQFDNAHLNSNSQELAAKLSSLEADSELPQAKALGHRVS